MDNGASSYRRFLNGDNEGLAEIVRDYKDGLMLYLNRFVNNLSVAEELMEEYETIKKISKTQRAAYAFVKKWFLGKYGEEFKAFQMKQDAKKQAAENRTYDNDKED